MWLGRFLMVYPDGNWSGVLVFWADDLLCCVHRWGRAIQSVGGCDGLVLPFALVKITATVTGEQLCGIAAERGRRIWQEERKRYLKYVNTAFTVCAKFYSSYLVYDYMHYLLWRWWWCCEMCMLNVQQNNNHILKHLVCTDIICIAAN